MSVVLFGFFFFLVPLNIIDELFTSAPFLARRKASSAVSRKMAHPVVVSKNSKICDCLSCENGAATRNLADESERSMPRLARILFGERFVCDPSCPSPSRLDGHKHTHNRLQDGCYLLHLRRGSARPHLRASLG
jgi:hypothetical protein